MRHWTILFALAYLVLPCAPGLKADDSDIFSLGPRVEPNVVILFDSSGSMDDRIDGVSKLDIAKAVITELLDNVEGVRFGVFAFKRNGGRVVAPVGWDRSATVRAVQAIVAEGATPLGQATGSIQEYFRGQLPDDSREGASHPSPITDRCQANYVILMTDGMPTGEEPNLVVDVARSLFGSDHSSLDGPQNVIVHTVGFDVPEGRALLQATADAGGGNLYTASSAAQLRAVLRDALSEIVEAIYAFTSPLIPSRSVTGGDKAYFAAFEPSGASPFWRGHLRAFQRDTAGLVPRDDAGEPLESALLWEAGGLLARRDPASRTIFTVIRGNRSEFVTTNAAITPALLGVGTDQERSRVINFIRGVDAYDADGDRDITEQRPWKLGDIYHSTPVLVFPPPLHSLEPDYREFQEQQAQRTTILLVGANDGMLHAFREADGQELWAFVPPDLLARLRQLTPGIGAHPFYVDSSPVVLDIKIGDAWRTVALFGERRGGGSYHALDVTDTEDPGYLWSFSDPSIAESWSEPAVGKVRLADGGERFVALFGGGYDTANNNASGAGFFVIDLATGQKLWNYRNTGSADSQYMNFSLAGAPIAADLNSDGYIDRAYIGDVGGQLWKFDLSAAATFSAGLVDNWLGKRLFAAAPGAPNPPPAGEYRPRQAMYGTPALTLDEQGQLWVFIGTGDRNRPNASSATRNRFYAIKDDSSMANGNVLTTSHLVDGATTDPVVQGWNLLLERDEKVLTSAEVFAGTVYFTTYTPRAAATCGGSTGEARLYAVRTRNGHAGLDWDTGHPRSTTDGTEARGSAIGAGIPSDPSVVLGETNDAIVVGTTDGEIVDLTLPRLRLKRQRYWREVF